MGDDPVRGHGPDAARHPAHRRRPPLPTRAAVGPPTVVGRTSAPRPGSATDQAVSPGRDVSPPGEAGRPPGARGGRPGATKARGAPPRPPTPVQHHRRTGRSGSRRGGLEGWVLGRGRSRVPSRTRLRGGDGGAGSGPSAAWDRPRATGRPPAKHERLFGSRSDRTTGFDLRTDAPVRIQPGTARSGSSGTWRTGRLRPERTDRGGRQARGAMTDAHRRQREILDFIAPGPATGLPALGARDRRGGRPHLALHRPRPPGDPPAPRLPPPRPDQAAGHRGPLRPGPSGAPSSAARCARPPRGRRRRRHRRAGQENVEEPLPVPADFTGEGELFMLRVRATP